MGGITLKTASCRRAWINRMNIRRTSTDHPHVHNVAKFIHSLWAGNFIHMAVHSQIFYQMIVFKYENEFTHGKLPSLSPVLSLWRKTAEPCLSPYPQAL
jgi:hypothetical protein